MTEDRKISKVLVVIKQSFKAEVMNDKLESQENKALQERFQKSDPMLARALAGHDEHINATAAIRAEIEKRQLAATYVNREDGFNQVAGDTGALFLGQDLIVTIGGDGTLLGTSQYLSTTPVLGIKSSKTSHGHFCIADVDSFPTILDEILAGKRKPLKLLRLQLSIDGKVRPFPILNEAKVTGQSPADFVRYQLTAPGLSEEQGSSGLYVGTPAGSTGSIRSAGGVVLPVTSRLFEFVVSELFMDPDDFTQRTRKRILNESDSIKLVSRMRRGRIYCDGHEALVFNYGSEAIISPAADDLHAYVEANINDRYLRVNHQDGTYPSIH